MGEFLDTVAKLAVLAFVVACMAAAGLGLTVRDVVAPLRRGRLVALSLVANFVVAPAVALAITAVVPLARPHAVGLLLLGGAAGAPFLPKLAAAAHGDEGFAIGLLLLLTVGSVVFMPLALPLMVPGLAAEPWPILRPLLTTVLLPLGLAMAVRSRSPVWAVRVRPAVGRASNVAAAAAVLLLVGLNAGPMLATFGSGAVAAATAFVGLAFAAGLALGGPDRGTRTVVGLGTGQRNVAAALVVATQNFTDPGVIVTILVATLAGLVVLLAAARALAPANAAGVRPAPVPEETCP